MSGAQVKIGDTVWLAFTRFGKWPTIEKAKILKAGPKQIATTQGNWPRGSAAICATRADALKQLSYLIQGKINSSLREVEDWQGKLAEVRALIAEAVAEEHLDA